MFRTYQGRRLPRRLPQELAIAGIRDMTAANRYLDEVYHRPFNAEFMPPALEEGSAFVT